MRQLFLTFLLIISWLAHGQRYVSDSSNVDFFSSAPLEDIAAENTASNSVLDLETGEFVFRVPIKDFQFDKSLMQEHFNENYLESDRFPYAFFKGEIIDWNGKPGKQQVVAAGEMDIHGVKQQVEIESIIEYSESDVTVKSTFEVALDDYKIKKPKAVFYNIADIIEVNVYFHYDPYQQ
jgi:polyisoprenoid-binding protein YceI